MNVTAVVDTHALIWFLGQNSLLGKKAKEILLDPSSKLIIPVIVLCEFYAYLKKKKEAHRYPKIYDDIRNDERFLFRDITPAIVLKIPPL